MFNSMTFHPSHHTNQPAIYLLTGIAVLIFMGTLLMVTEYETWQYWFIYWWMFPVAFIIAITVNTLGVSGAALFVPFFILIFPFFATSLTTTQSVQLGLITESFGLSSSALAFIAFGLVDKKLAILSFIGALPFVISGALLTVFIPKAVLLSMIAILLIVSVLLIRYKKNIESTRVLETKKHTINLSTSEGLPISIQSQDGKKYTYCRTSRGYKKRFFGYGIGGFFQGAAGFGIGEMGIISMILSRIPTRVAIGTSHLVVASTAIIASSIHLFVTNGVATTIPWNLPFMTVPAVVIGGQLAPFVAAKLPTKLLEQFISLLFIGIAIALVILVVHEI